MMLVLWLLACKPSADAVATGVASQNPAVREDMVAFAKTYDEPQVVAALHQALLDGTPRVRLLAAQSLGEICAPESVQPLIGALSDSDPKVQSAAIDALGRIADPLAVDPVLTYLVDHLGENVPLNAIWALGRFKDRKAVGVLAGLRESSDPYVAWNALEALREIGDGAVTEGPTLPKEAAPEAEQAPEEEAEAQPEEQPAEDLPEDEGDGDLPPEEPSGAVPDEPPPPIVVPWPGG